MAFTTINPNTICVESGANVFDGEMNVTVTNIGTYLLTDFVFTWKDATPTVIPGFASTKLDTRDVGFYSVEAKNTKTGCLSAPITGQVPDGKIYPIIDIVTTGSHNCTTAPGIVPDGTAAATVTNAGADIYSFVWSAVGLSPAINNATNNANLAIAIKLGGPTNAPNAYQVVVTNNRTGCVNNNTGLVGDLSQKPTFTLTPTPNTVCDITVPGGPTQFDGEAVISAVTHPQLGASTITYVWFDANPVTGVITGPNASSTTTVLDNLDNGRFAATVTIDALGCTSDPLVTEVLDDFSIPVIATATTPNFNCVGPNGSAQVTSVDGAATTNYFISWYNGVTVSGAAISTNTLLGNNLQGPATSYTVQAINKNTGCAGNTSVTVVDAKVTPTMAVTVTKNNTICDTPTIDPDGELLASVGNIAGAFTITWSGGPAPAAQAGVNGERYIKLNAGGPYSAFVMDNVTGCPSSTDSQNIIDNFTYPAIAVTITNQTSCGVTPNGALAITPVAGDTYAWFDGLGTGTPHAPSVATSITQLASADYTVQATTTLTGCKSVQTNIVPDNVTLPVVTLTNSVSVTTCGSTPNGQATTAITGLVGAPAFAGIKYDIFYVFTKTGDPFPTTVPPLIASADKFVDRIIAGVPTKTGLAPGFVTAYVVDKNTSCESIINTVQIIDDTKAYTFNIDAKRNAGVCGGGGGGIDVTVVRTGTAGPCPSCTYTWYSATPTNTNINFFDNPPNMGAAVPLAPPLVLNEDLGPPPGGPSLPGVGAGTYTLVVVDTDPAHKDCGSFHVDFVPPSSAPTIVTTLTDITDCVTPNGKIDVTVNGASVLGYTIKIFQGTDNTGALVKQLLLPAKPAILSTSPNLLASSPNIVKGEYFIEALDNDAANINCPFGQVVILEQKALPPILSVSSISANTSCDPSTSADGSVTLTVTNNNLDVLPKLYRIADQVAPPVAAISPAVTGYLTPNTIGTGASGQSETIPGMEPIDYTIRVVDVNSNCSSTVTVTIPNVQDTPDVLNVVPTAETMCANSSNGSALASLANGEVRTRFDFTWAQNNDLSLPVYAAAGNGANAGELINRANATANTPGNFWPMGAVGAGSGDRIFFVQGIRNATSPSGVGCKTAVVQIVIPDGHVAPDLVLTPAFDSFCLATALNGQIGDGMISIAADANPALAGQQNAAGGFDYSWTTPNAGLASPQLAQSNNFQILQLGDGIYTVTATNRDNDCRVANSTTIAPAPFVITIDTTDPIIDQRICNNDGLVRINQITLTDNSVGNPNSETVNNAAIDPLYVFKWYNNAALTAGTELDDASAADVDVRTLSNDADQNGVTAATDDFPLMGAGSYFVIATRSNPAQIGFGCPSLPFRADVKDVHVNPITQLTPISNTSCIPAGPGEGEILILVNDATAAPFNAGTFTYVWDVTNPQAIATTLTNDGDNVDSDGDGDHPKILLDGTYHVTITNNTTNCLVLATTTIIKNATPVFVQDVDVVDQVLCAADGSITVQSVTLNDRNGVSQTPSIADFDFLWQRSASGFTQTTVGPAATAKTLDMSNYNAAGFGVALGFDTYTVVARRRTGSPGAGCSSGPYQVIMQDDRIFPVATLTPFSNTSCSSNPLAQEGEITISVTDNTTATGPPVGFTYTWNGGNPTVIAAAAFPATNDGDGLGTDGDEDHPIGLREGVYNMTVQSNKSGCTSTASTTILKNAVPVFVQTVTAVDQVLCGNDGSLNVTQVAMNDRNGNTQIFNSGTTPPIGNFIFTYDRTTAGNTVLNNSASTTLNIGNYGAIGFDSYFVVATRNTGSPGAGCKSAPFKVDILDKRIFPVVTLTPFANTSCSSTPADLEGEIKVKVADGSVNPSAPFVTPFSYTYNWTTSATPGVISGLLAGTSDGDEDGTDGDRDHPTLLAEGNYSVTVRNTQTNCPATSSTSILKNSTPVFTQLVTPTDQVLCAADGRLIVNEVRLIDRNGTIKSSNADFAIGDFDFTYSRNTLANTVPVVSGTQLNNVNFPTIGADTYFVVATRRTNGPGLGCSSPPFKVDIQNKQIFPVVSLTPFANTSCSSTPADLEGEIKVKVTDASVNLPFVPAPFVYNYTWTVSATPGVISGLLAGTSDGDEDGTDGDRDHPTLLAEGNYSVTVRNTQTNCPATSSTSILKNSTPVFTQLVTPTDQVLCAADGRLIVNEVRLIDRNGTIKSSNADFAIGDFDFTYSRNTLANTVPVVSGTQLNNVNFPTIGADTYFVVATRRTNGPGLGCSSPPFKVDILNKQILPIVALSPFANTSCDPAFFEGEVKVKVTDASVNLPFVPTPFVYTYNWTTSATPGVISGLIVGTNDGDEVGTDGDGDNPIGLRDGVYTVSATNTQTGCGSTGSTTIFRNSTPVFTQLVIPTDQVLCNPDGSLLVNEVKVIDRNGTIQSNLTGDFPISDFMFSYDRASIGNTVLSNSPSVLLDNTNYNTIGFDSYYVVATRVTGGPGRTCSSAPYKVDIQDKRLFPKVSYTFVPNSSCSVLIPNGQVQATALEQDNTFDTYLFNWKFNNTNLPIASPQIGSTIVQSAVGNIGNLANSPEGNYSLTVQNQITGCNFISDVTVTVDRNVSLPNIITVNKTEPTTCIGDGSAVVTSISIGGGPPFSGAAIAPPNFEYEWYRGNFAPANLLATVAPLLSPIANGKYYVLVKDLTTDCKSAPTEVELKDQNIVYPVVEITLTTPQISCDPTYGTGVLMSTADNQNDTNPNYTFAWFPSLDITGTRFATTSTISGLKNGNYSLEVENLLTGCKKSALYIVPDNGPQFFPQLALSSTERTLCAGQDGSVFAGIININPAYPFPLDFSADLYFGNKVNDPNLATLTPDIPNMPNVPGFAQNFTTPNNLAEGFYTVRIVDNNTGCATVQAEEIADARKLPEVVVVPENPNVNCDDTIANGQLSATANNNQIAGYTFDWFTGATIPNAATPIVTGNHRLIGRIAGDYSVRVTRQLTGCVSDKSGKIIDGRIIPPAPTALVMRDRTNCDFPNGWVASNVKGITIAHTFKWYDGSAVKPAHDFIGSDYFDRDVGPYSVTATDMITGCVSLPATVAVKDARVIPLVNITSTPAFCLTASGVFTLELINNQEVVLTDISWYDATGNRAGGGPEVYNLPAGAYTVEFVSSEGCEGDASLEMGTQILSYNLVSANGDGANDLWIVDCLQNFPNNNVKVFNRSGIKVYEADGYDNSNIVFKGFGEQGVYLLGDKLPDGTYFYIIDKGDGSKPVTGYFELIR